jgi:hypothetical protein
MRQPWKKAAAPSCAGAAEQGRRTCRRTGPPNMPPNMAAEQGVGSHAVHGRFIAVLLHPGTLAFEQVNPFTQFAQFAQFIMRIRRQIFACELACGVIFGFWAIFVIHDLQHRKATRLLSIHDIGIRTFV